MKNENSLIQNITVWIEEKLAPKLVKIFDRPTIRIIKDSVLGAMPAIMLGSIACIIGTMGTNNIGGRVILPFISPIVDKVYLIQGLSLGALTLYVAINLGINYAKEYDLDAGACAIISVASLLFIGINDGLESMGTVAGSGALFVAMFACIFALFIYKTCINKKIVIKMPKGVPPMVSNSFSAIIPFAIITILYWLIRTIMNIDIIGISSTLLSPLFNGADNVFVFAIYNIITKLCWFVGLHDSMFSGIITPLTTYWTAQNAAAMQAGTELQYVWTVALERTCMWIGPNIGLTILCLRSKVQYLRDIGKVAVLPVIFGVGEPIVFGVVMLNPIMLIPFVAVPTITAIVNYLLVDMGLLAKCFVELPWATPPFIIGWMASGDWKYIIVSLINLAFAIIAFKPFFSIWEKQLIQEQKEELEING